MPWDQLWAWWIYDHEIEPDSGALDRKELRAAKIAAEVHNVPIRMGWVGGDLLQPKDFMMPSYEERLRKQKGEQDQQKLLCNTVSIEEWRAWKKSLLARANKK